MIGTHADPVARFGRFGVSVVGIVGYRGIQLGTFDSIAGPLQCDIAFALLQRSCCCVRLRASRVRCESSPGRPLGRVKASTRTRTTWVSLVKLPG